MESRDERERRAQTNERDEGQRRESRDKIFLFFYNTATVQFYLQNCTVASIAKNLQYLPLPFFDVDDFRGINAKFSLDMTLAFFNANALRFKLLAPLFIYQLIYILKVIVSKD